LITSQRATSIKPGESSLALLSMWFNKCFCLCWSKPLQSTRATEGGSFGYYNKRKEKST